jgi:hypothetical protein
MLTGTVSDLDNDGLFEVIDADDGRLLSFNPFGTPPPNSRINQGRNARETPRTEVCSYRGRSLADPSH